MGWVEDAGFHVFLARHAGPGVNARALLLGTARQSNEEEPTNYFIGI